jgi:hypothetical protein
METEWNKIRQESLRQKRQANIRLPTLPPQQQLPTLPPQQQQLLQTIVQQNYAQHPMPKTTLAHQVPNLIDEMETRIRAATPNTASAASLRPNIEHEWTRLHIQRSRQQRSPQRNALQRNARNARTPTTNKEHREQALKEVSWKTEDEKQCGHCGAILLPGYVHKPWPNNKQPNHNPNREFFERYDERREIVSGGYFCCNYGTEKKEWLPVIPKELWDVYLSKDREPPPPHLAETSKSQGRMMSFSYRSRFYNNLFCMSGIGHTPSEGKWMTMKDFNMPNIPANVTIHGKLYHRVGPLANTADGGKAMVGCANWYIHGDDGREVSAVSKRLQIKHVRTIKKILYQTNALIKNLVAMGDKQPAEEVAIVMRYDPDAASNEIAVLHQETTTLEGSDKQRMVVFHKKSTGEACFVNSYSWLYEPLQYPLIFTHGTAGWGKDFKGHQTKGTAHVPATNSNSKKRKRTRATTRTSVLSSTAVVIDDTANTEPVTDTSHTTSTTNRTSASTNTTDNGTDSNTDASSSSSTTSSNNPSSSTSAAHSSNPQTPVAKNITIKRYMKQMMLCEPVPHALGRLFNEYLCDGYLRVEENDLNFLRKKNREARNSGGGKRVAPRNIAARAVESGNGESVGKVKLHRSFRYGPRAKRKLIEDGLTIVRRLGKPTYFITVTCNPEWPEITKRLNPETNQTAFDRPDICSMVFQKKLAAIMKFIEKGGLQQKIESDEIKRVFVLHVIEFQKRGLPHAHIALKLSPEPSTIEQIDKVVSAEWKKHDGTKWTKRQSSILTDTFVKKIIEFKTMEEYWISPAFEAKHILADDNEAPCLIDELCTALGKPSTETELEIMKASVRHWYEQTNT